MKQQQSKRTRAIVSRNKPPLEPDTSNPEVQKRMQAQKLKKVQAMLDGKEPIPSPLVQYLVDELRATSAEQTAVIQNIQQHEQMLSLLKKRHVELGGITGKYREDIMKHVDDEPLEEPEEPTPAEPKLEAVPDSKDEEEPEEPDPEPVV